MSISPNDLKSSFTRLLPEEFAVLRVVFALGADRIPKMMQ